MRNAHLITQLRIEAPEALDMPVLREFAEECHTKIEERFPLYLVFVDGQLVGFYYASPCVSIRPTVHPTRMSPRAFYEAARAIVGAAQRRWPSVIWHIDSLSRLAEPALLRKIGLSPLPLKVYEVGVM